VVSIQVTGAAPNGSTVPATDPDVYVFRQGAVVAFGDSTAPNSETLSQISLSAGTYVIEVYDYGLTGTGSTPHCMTVSIAG
jgi:hypothetical protein